MMDYNTGEVTRLLFDNVDTFRRGALHRYRIVTLQSAGLL